MNSILVLVVGIGILIAGYVFYGKWLAEQWGVDPKRKTPAFTEEDGVDYVPAKAPVLMGHHFSSIAGAGPINGPIQAAVFGWVPVLLWVLIGGIFFGGVHDYGALFASLRHKGQSIGEVIADTMGSKAKKLFIVFAYLTLILVVAAFGSIVANTFKAAYTESGAVDVAASSANATTAMISILFIVLAVVFGFMVYRRNVSLGVSTIAGVAAIVVCVVVGLNFHPIYLSETAWMVIVGIYITVASVAPVWILLQPRDYLSSFLLYAMLAVAAFGVIVAHPTFDSTFPAVTSFAVDNGNGTQYMFPVLFTTVACGAISGFHSLVSSDTSSKTIANEKDMLKVGYGAMVLESLLAVVALCVAGAAASADGTPAAGTPFQVFSNGVAGFLEMFGIPLYVAQCFMTMCVSALALTSLDAVARIGRMSFQELFSVDDMAHAEPWRKLFCNTYFSTALTLAFGFLLTQIGYANIWPLFGSANQLLSALVLATLCVFLKVTGRSNKMLFPPLVIMLCVTFTALVQRLIAMVKAISTAASVTIPAGETTWGAVFIANGLQLILAVLLIVLGLNIVFHSFSAYKKAEHNSEANV